MINTIIVKRYGSKIIDIIQDRPYTWHVLENGMKLTRQQLDSERILIQCHQCEQFSEISYYGGKNGLRYRTYICQSCIKIGDKNPFYGRHHTEELKKQLSEERSVKYSGSGNPFYGKNHSETTKEKISQKLKESGKCKGENNPFFNKRHSQETLDRLSQKTKIWAAANPEHYVANGIKSVLKQLKGLKTSIERRVDEELHKLGVEDYKYCKIIGGKQYDFIIGKYILLEVHGDFWHANPLLYGDGDGKKPLTERQKFKQKRDIEKKEYAENNGYTIFYIWEHDINNGNFSVLHDILQYRRLKGA